MAPFPGQGYWTVQNKNIEMNTCICGPLVLEEMQFNQLPQADVTVTSPQ